MKIRLNEIPAEGRNYLLTRESGELTEGLSDLLGDRAFEVSLTVRPLGNTYEVVGTLKTRLSDLCSKCGWDLDWEVRRKLHDYLVEEDPDEYRKSQHVHGNQSLDYLAEGPTVATFKNDIFDVTNYIHEQVALEQPFYPSCGKSNCEHLQEAQAKLSELAREFALAEEKRTGHPGFEKLKTIKLPN